MLKLSDNNDIQISEYIIVIRRAEVDVDRLLLDHGGEDGNGRPNAQLGIHDNAQREPNRERDLAERVAFVDDVQRPRVEALPCGFLEVSLRVATVFLRQVAPFSSTILVRQAMGRDRVKIGPLLNVSSKDNLDVISARLDHRFPELAFPA